VLADAARTIEDAAAALRAHVTGPATQGRSTRAIPRRAFPRVHVRGRLLAGDRVTVEAHGVFVPLPPERVMRLLDD
jgi:hypothetical protein